MVVTSGTIPFPKEMAIRKRIASIYNKREEDFPSMREYNDYLEAVEDMTWSLINGENVAAIEMSIAEYEKQNYDQIMNSRARKAEELAAALTASKGRPVQTDNETDSSQNPQMGLSGAPHGQYVPAIAGAAFQPRPIGMAPQPLPHGGGADIDDEEMMRRRSENGGRAGGWSPEFSRKRALEEAFGSLWIQV
ncbi:hypothetical protein Dimus_025788 [Dionaea muscipula]